MAVINPNLPDVVTGQGYLATDYNTLKNALKTNAVELQNALDAIGLKITSAQAQTLITAYGYQTAQQVLDAITLGIAPINTALTGKASNTDLTNSVASINTALTGKASNTDLTNLVSSVNNALGTKVPNTTTITVNGNTQPLTDNVSFTVTGTVNEAQVLTATGATKLNGGNTGDNATRIPNWFKKFKASPSTVKMVLVGDSTSDQGGNASSYPATLKSLYTYKGDVLAGFNSDTNMPNFGSNGNTIVNFMANLPAGVGIESLIASAPDLIVFCYGINDVRQNLLTKDQLKAIIITAVNRFRAEIPNVSIVLRMPNSFLSVGSLIVQGSYPDIATAAQAQTDILYYTYKELENYWDSNVILLNTQDQIYGRVCQPSSPLMTDQLHPVYDVMLAELTKLIGYREPFNETRANAASVSSYATPWTVYDRSLELTSKYKLLWSGRYGGQGSTYIDVTGDSYDLAGKILPGDIVNVADTLTFEVVSGNAASISSDSTKGRISVLTPATIPTNTITGGFVKVYRNIALNTSTIEPYIKDIKTYPYRRKVLMSACGTDFLSISVAYDEDLGTSRTPGLIPSRFKLLPTDVLCVEGLAPLVLTGSTFTLLNANILQINKTGAYATYANKIAYIFGNHAYENPNTELFNVKVGTYQTLLTSNGVLGMTGTSGGLVVQEPVGLKRVNGVIYQDISLPAGNTITNTLTKTYFSSFLTIPIAGTLINQMLNFSGWGLITTDATTPGTINFGLDTLQTLAQGTVANLGSTGAVALPVGLTSALFKFSIDVFVVTASSVGTVECQGELTIINGVTLPIKNTARITVNTAVSEDYKLFTTFSVATANNSIQLRTLRVTSV